MSIRSLLSTTINSTESAVKGIVSLGDSIGDTTKWIKRQSSRLNHETVVLNEEREFRANQMERAEMIVARMEKLDPELESKLDALDKFLGIK